MYICSIFSVESCRETCLIQAIYIMLYTDTFLKWNTLFNYSYYLRIENWSTVFDVHMFLFICNGNKVNNFFQCILIGGVFLTAISNLHGSNFDLYCYSFAIFDFSLIVQNRDSVLESSSINKYSLLNLIRKWCLIGLMKQKLRGRSKDQTCII